MCGETTGPQHLPRAEHQSLGLHGYHGNRSFVHRFPFWLLLPPQPVFPFFPVLHSRSSPPPFPSSFSNSPALIFLIYYSIILLCEALLVTLNSLCGLMAVNTQLCSFRHVCAPVYTHEHVRDLRMLAPFDRACASLTIIRKRIKAGNVCPSLAIHQMLLGVQDLLLDSPETPHLDDSFFGISVNKLKQPGLDCSYPNKHSY